jgi:DNA replication protein DnaC
MTRIQGVVERANRYASLILTSNLPFARWGDVFGDQVVAAAMIDRIVHHADVLLPTHANGSRRRFAGRHQGNPSAPSMKLCSGCHLVVAFSPGDVFIGDG